MIQSGPSNLRIQICLVYYVIRNFIVLNIHASIAADIADKANISCCLMFCARTACACGRDDKAALEDKRQLRAHSSLLANYLDRFETIAEEVGGHEDKDAVQQSADRLRLNVRSLREVSPINPPRLEL